MSERDELSSSRYSYSGGHKNQRVSANADSATSYEEGTTLTLQKKSDNNATVGKHDTIFDYITNGCSACMIPNEIVVKVMAFANPTLSVVCDYASEEIPLPDTPGFICVGRVMSQLPAFSDIQMDDRVMCILPEAEQGHTELYAKLPFHALMKVAKDVNAWSQIALVLTYLPALQALQSCPFTVKNKKILINGGVGPVCRALVNLAHLHGAKKIYVPVQKNDRNLIRDLGAKTLGPTHQDWGPTMMGELDIVVDSIGENNFVTSKAALKKKGHLVCIGCSAIDSRSHTKNVMSAINKKYVEMRLNSSTRTTIYSLLSSWTKERESFVQDFEYLSNLMSTGEIKPIAKRVTIEEYRNTAAKSTTLEGIAICDPLLE